MCLCVCVCMVIMCLCEREEVGLTNTFLWTRHPGQVYTVHIYMYV